MIFRKKYSWSIILSFLLIMFILGALLIRQKETSIKLSFKDVNQDAITFLLETSNLSSIKWELIKYKDQEVAEIVPLGQVVYHQKMDDEGVLLFNFKESINNAKVVIASLQTKGFNGTLEIQSLYSSTIDLKDYKNTILIESIKGQQADKIDIIRFDKDNSEISYRIRMSWIF